MIFENFTGTPSGKDGKSIAAYNNELISTLLFERPYSCIEMSRRTNLSHTAIALIVSRLKQLNVVKSAEPLPADLPKKKGGQHVRYSINEALGLFVCISFQVNADTFRIYDFSKKLLYSADITLGEHISREDILNLIAQIKGCLAEHHETRPVLAVSISIQGQIDTETRTILLSTRLENRSTSLYDCFSEAFHCPVEIYNDAVITAYGDISEDPSALNSCVCYFIFGFYGIVSAILNKGDFVTSRNGFSGEIGMNYIREKDTDLRTCCLMSNFAAKYRDIVQRNDTESIMAASSRSRELHDELEESARILGNELRNSGNLLGIDKFIICGECAKMRPFYRNALESALLRPASYAPENNRDIAIEYRSDVPSLIQRGLREIAASSALKDVLKKY